MIDVMNNKIFYRYNITSLQSIIYLTIIGVIYMLHYRMSPYRVGLLN